MSAAWLAAVCVLFALAVADSERSHREHVLSAARASFESIVLTRRWNAMHGGVYVPVADGVQPNPYLKDPQRDIKVSDSLTLTKINPAYMTRQLSELSAESNNVRIHITSLRPVRPENQPSPLERAALEAFERGIPDAGEILKDSTGTKFFYMAPLKTEKSCLRCHASHGYEEGDIRGGISIIAPVAPDTHMKGTIVRYSAIGLAGLIGIFLFSTSLRKSYEIIERQAVIDSLTGIANRHAFMQRIRTEFARSARNKTPLSLIMIDIDHFKRYNDTYGHSAGDDCLRTVARAIQKTIKRPADFCARYGGEEFVVMLPETGLGAAVSMAGDIRANVEKMNMPHEKSSMGVVTISLGVASTKGTQSESYETVLKESDMALYRAKGKGRNRVEA